MTLITFNLKRITIKPNPRTFRIPQIDSFCYQYDKFEFLDVFPFPFEQDALQMLKKLKTNSIQNIRLDPPYTQNQLKTLYKNLGISFEINSSYWKNIELECKRVMKKGGYLIRFGYNSKIINGFSFVDGLTCYAGGQHHDLIVTVQIKK